MPARYLLAVAVTDDGVLVAGRSGAWATDDRVSRWDGARFHNVAGLGGVGAGGLGGIDPRLLAARGRGAALATSAGSLFVSADAGRTWQATGPTLDRPQEVAV